MNNFHSIFTGTFKLCSLLNFCCTCSACPNLRYHQLFSCNYFQPSSRESHINLLGHIPTHLCQFCCCFLIFIEFSVLFLYPLVGFVFHSPRWFLPTFDTGKPISSQLYLVTPMTQLQTSERLPRLARLPQSLPVRPLLASMCEHAYCILLRTFCCAGSQLADILLYHQHWIWCQEYSGGLVVKNLL